jgi:hypothetical protein
MQLAGSIKDGGWVYTDTHQEAKKEILDQCESGRLTGVHGREPLGSRDRGRHGKCPVLAYRRAAVKRGEASLHFTFTFVPSLAILRSGGKWRAYI